MKNVMMSDYDSTLPPMRDDPMVIDLSNPDNRFYWEDEAGGHIDSAWQSLDRCRYCGYMLQAGNRRIADGCSCNSPRGINHGLVPKNTCTCRECDLEQTGSTRYGGVTPPAPKHFTSTPMIAEDLSAYSSFHAFIYRSVRDFHLRGNVPCPEQIEFPGEEIVKLRQRLNAEEVSETNDALEARDMVEAADGIIDSIYVLMGNAIALGISENCFTELWYEVQHANMSKFVWDETEKKWSVYKDAEGKITKPPGWTPPDIAGILKAHGWKGG